MAYSDFTLDMVETQLGLFTDTRTDYFASASPAILSGNLKRHLEKYTSLALHSGSEKARSELIIMPIILEVLEQYPPGFGLFSGVDFSPDPARNLRGICDYVLTFAPAEPIIRAPVVTIAEAKRDDISTGLGQCVAEMVGAQVFNEARNSVLPVIYGVVTTGTTWRFLRLIGSTVYMDKSEYYLKEADKIVGILLAMLHEAAVSRQSMQII